MVSLTFVLQGLYFFLIVCEKPIMSKIFKAFHKKTLVYHFSVIYSPLALGTTLFRIYRFYDGRVQALVLLVVPQDTNLCWPILLLIAGVAEDIVAF